MILFGIILGVIGLFASFVYGRKNSWRAVGTIVFGLLLIGSVTAIVGNDTHHWAMHRSTTRQQTVIKASKQTRHGPLLLAVKLDHAGHDKAYVYKTSGNQTKHTNPETTRVRVCQNGKANSAAIMTTKRHEWQYSRLGKIMFAGLRNNHELIYNNVGYSVPSTWHVLTIQHR
ncbi:MULTISPECIES: DUF4811 domain-containing protein [Furfurilactobacillus]|uniref:DUF4811 domain-containing protein n=1 Tax=Furfurilactobacillus rossiae TaxID=231049 RepID=A0A7C9N7F6_9LACO|nr:DUF4811 domain-containing protein [Furfurilactobacillus milii]MYV05652.1 DUF4811 domain-containing protein [Furfurilactobacillus milii]